MVPSVRIVIYQRTDIDCKSVLVNRTVWSDGIADLAWRCNRTAEADVTLAGRRQNDSVTFPDGLQQLVMAP